MYTVIGHTARMTGAFWFIVVDEDTHIMADGTVYYSDHEDAQLKADELNERI